MKIRMSDGLTTRWGTERLDEALGGVTLPPRLQSLISAPFVREAGCLVLEPLLNPSRSAASFQDQTAYEAFVNKFHVEDFVDEDSSEPHERMCALVFQGMKSAMAMAQRLEGEGLYRIVLSLDAEMGTAVLRFFERRCGEPWGFEDPNEATREELLMIDTGFG